MTMRRLALIGALLLLPIAALAHLKVGPGAVGIPTGGGAPGTVIVLCQSAVAVPLTGSTAETALATCTIPAGLMGPNGSLSIEALFSNNNSGNNKTSRVRFSSISGAIYSQTTATTNLGNRFSAIRISNRNATNSQVGFSGSVFVTATAPVTSAVDTTAATTIVVTGQLANGADNMSLESYSVELMRGN